MSRLCGYGILGLVAAGCADTAAQAQTVAEQRARVEHLATRLADLDARVDSLERLEDTVEVDGVRFVVSPGHRSGVTEAARLALAELERRYGAEDRRLLNGWVYRLREIPSRDGGLQRTVNAIVAAAGQHRLHDLGGLALNQWGGWWGFSEHDLEGAYLDLVTSPSTAAKACFEGSTDQCAKILGLGPVDDPWTELFDEGGRRVWIDRRMPWLRWADWPAPRAARAALFRRCVDDRVDAACLELLHTQAFAPVLVSGRTKRSVIHVAQVMGGEGALTRLLADTTAQLGDRLAAATRAPLDSLLAAWHQRMLTAEPAPTRVGPMAGWMSVVVVILAGALALRSTRWRLG